MYTSELRSGCFFHLRLQGLFLAIFHVFEIELQGAGFF